MITLSSDFGSPYPAAMKGVLLSRCGEGTRLLDITHDLPRQDVRASAFWLREVLPYCPPGVHLAVVDPGVGTDRDAVVVRVGDHALVAPDNGLAMPAARELGDPEVFVVDYEGGAGDWLADPASSTFHGRDVFAPTAAEVHELGVENATDLPGVTPASDPVDLRLPAPDVEDDGVVGEALAVDGFGNVITNVPGDLLYGHLGDHVKVNGIWATARYTYADVEEGHRVVTVGSHGNVELAVNQGRGDETFGVYAGGRVTLRWS